MPDPTPEVPATLPERSQSGKPRSETDAPKADERPERVPPPATFFGASAAQSRAIDAVPSRSVYPSFRRARSMTHSEARDSTRGWTTRDAMDLFNVHAWGAPYFSINAAGNVEVRPSGTESPAIDLYELVDDLRRRGFNPPLLIRFSDILKARVD